MTRLEFIEKLNDFLEYTGMSTGAFGSYISVGDDAEINTDIYIDKDNNVWLTGRDSIIRIKTSINVDNVTELRYDSAGDDVNRFFIICKDYSGLDFSYGKIRFFENGYIGDPRNALEWFEKNPVT